MMNGSIHGLRCQYVLGDNGVATCMTGRYLSHRELGENRVVPHFLNAVSSNAHSSSLYSHTLDLISMDLFNVTHDFYPTFPVAGGFDTDMDFNLASAIQSMNIPTLSTSDDKWIAMEQPSAMAGPPVDLFVEGNYSECHVHQLGRFVFNLWPSDSVAPATPQPTQTYAHCEQPDRGQRLPEGQPQPRSSSLANWDGSIATGVASEPDIPAPAPRNCNNTLCFIHPRVRMLTDREQARSIPG